MSFEDAKALLLCNLGVSACVLNTFNMYATSTLELVAHPLLTVTYLQHKKHPSSPGHMSKHLS